MANFNNLMKQAQQMQAKLAGVQKELEAREFEGSAGGGMVKVVVSGKQQVLSVRVNPECLSQEDSEMLEDMIKSATNEALEASSSTVSSAMSKITGGLNIPGMF